MSEWCQQRTSAEVLAGLAQAGIPCGEMLSPREVLKNEHVVEAGMLKPVAYPGASSPAPIAEHPIRYSKTPVAEFNRAPTLSEHTQEILTEIGYDAGDISRLKAAGII